MHTERKNHIKPVYFANWSDLFGFPLAANITQVLIKFSFINPNHITITAFLLYILGSLSLLLLYPYHLLVSAMLLPVAFILDDVDGQLARLSGKMSTMGDYLDKVLDVLKIFIITASLSFAVFAQNKNPLYIYLGFIAGFFFMYRYYIKLETMFSATNTIPNYLEKSSQKRTELEKNYDMLHAQLTKTFPGKLCSLFLKHRIFFWVDEAEFAIITAFGALMNRLDVALWILALSQVSISIWRFAERAQQLHTQSAKLLHPLRK